MGNQPTKSEGDTTDDSDDLSSPLGSSSSSSTRTFIEDRLSRLSSAGSMSCSSETLDLATIEIDFADLNMSTPIASGPHGQVFQAVMFDRPVAVKVFDKRILDGKDKTRLEGLRFDLAAIGAMPNHPNLINFVGYVSGPFAVVSELNMGGNLSDALFSSVSPASMEPLSWMSRAKIALDIANALAFLHSNGVVHGNLKMENVLLNRPSLTGRLSDGGMRSIVSWASHPLYASPEEIAPNGCAGKPSDVYGLGIIMFELLAEKRAYNDYPNPIEVPRRVVNESRFRPSLSTILQREGLHKSQLHFTDIMKSCWDADPAQRPLATELVTLLNDIIEQISNPHYVSRFELVRSGNVMSHRAVFSIPDKLYGREIELQSLKDIFSQQQHVHSNRCIVVSGPAGAGKTAFVLQAVAQVTASFNAEFFSFHTGKFEQNSIVPYDGIVQAFCSAVEARVIRPIQKNPKLGRSWKSALERALGKNAAIFVQLIPPLKNILCKDLKSSSGMGFAESANVQVVEAFCALSRTLTGQQHHLLLYVDNAHLADSRSVLLISKLLSTNPLLSVLLSFQDIDSKEGKSESALNTLLSTVRKIPTIRVHSIHLLIPSVADMNQMCSDALRCPSADRVMPLTELIYRKVHGTPCHFRKFLSLLHQQGLIDYDNNSGSWTWDLLKIQTLSLSLSDDLLDIMLSDLRKLPLKPQNLLKLASRIGKEFRFDVLAAAAQEIEMDDGSKIGVISEADLTECVGGNYLQTSNGASVFEFMHDRVQSSAQDSWKDWDTRHAPRVRLAIGLIMKRIVLPDLTTSINREIPSRLVSAIAEHMNTGRNLLNSKRELLELVLINFTASLWSQESIEFSKSLEFCRIAIEILRNQITPLLSRSDGQSTSTIWNDDECRQMALQVFPLAQKLEYLHGSSQLGDQHFSEIRAHAHDMPNIVSGAFVTRALKLEADGRRIDGFQLLSEFISNDPTQSAILGQSLATPDAIGTLFSKVKDLLSRRDFCQISKAEIVTQEETSPMLNILCGIHHLIAFESSHLLLTRFYVLHAVAIVLGEFEMNLQKTPAASCCARMTRQMPGLFITLAWSAIDMNADFLFAQRIAEAVISNPLFSGIPDVLMRYNLHARVLSHSLKDIHHNFIEKSLPLAMSNGSRSEILDCCAMLVSCSWISGKSIRSLTKKYDETIASLNNSEIVGGARILKISRLLLFLDDPVQFEQEFLGFTRDSSPNYNDFISGAMAFYEAIVICCLLIGDTDRPHSLRFPYSQRFRERLSWRQAFELCSVALRLLPPGLLPLYMQICLQCLRCVAASRMMAEGGSSITQSDIEKTIEDDLTNLASWAKKLPVTFGAFHNFALAEHAAFVLKEQSFADSVLQHYKEALEFSGHAELTLLTAMIAEALGFFCKAQKLPDDAVRKYLLKARDQYRQFGAREKVKHLELLPLLAKDLTQQQQQSASVSSVSTPSGSPAAAEASGSGNGRDLLFEFAEWAFAEAERDERLRKLLEKHFEAEFTVEAFHFYFKAREYSAISSSIARRASVLRHIYNVFIMPQAPLEINVSNELRTRIGEIVSRLDNLPNAELQQQLTPDLLKDLMTSVRSDMIESLGRFRSSSEFKNFKRATRKHH